ncbi:MAG TPA: cation transporter dimerization domain-containing protein [Methanoregula sp.]|nr:cation transporter dimerization domain-containing protein [Methanoregula sp.]
MLPRCDHASSYAGFHDLKTRRSGPEIFIEFHLVVPGTVSNFPYSGVVTLSRIKPSRITKTFGNNQFDREGRIIISEYPSFVLYNCYFPTGASGKKTKI